MTREANDVRKRNGRKTWKNMTGREMTGGRTWKKVTGK